MDINELFKVINNNILEEDLISIVTLTPEQIEDYNKKGVIVPTHEKVYEFAEYLNADPKCFYVNPKNMCPICYFNNTQIIDLHTFDKVYFDMFDIKKTIEYRTKMENECIETKNFEKLFALMDKRIAMIAYKKMFDQIPDDKKYEIFINVYTLMEYGFQDWGIDFVKEVIKYKKKTSRTELVKKIKTFNGSEYLTIYRGNCSLSTPADKAFSWTTGLSVALKFAIRFDIVGDVYKAKIHIDDIIDFIDDRNEKEILLMPENLQDIEKIDLMHFKDIIVELENFNLIGVYRTYSNKIRPNYFKYADSIHGMLHAKRVLLLNIIIAHYLGLDNIDMKILCQAAAYHDIGRVNDNTCYTHGKLSIEKMIQLKLMKNNNSENTKIFKYIVENHCIEDEQAFKNIDDYNIKNKDRALDLLAIFKDADALDRVRIKDLDENYLRKDISKKLILVAQELLHGVE